MDFKIKTNEELAAMSAEELVTYHKEYTDAKNEEMKQLIESKADATAIEAFKKEMFEALQEQTKNLNQALATMVKGQVKKGVIAHDNVKEAIAQAKEQISDYLEGKSDNFKLTLKVDPMLFSNATTGTVIAPYYVQGINEIRTRKPFIRERVNNVPVGYNQTLVWLEEVAQVGGAGTTAEGDAKSQVQYKLEAKTGSLEKNTIFGTVSDEMLAEPFLSNFIKNKMLKDLDVYIDGKILTVLASNNTSFSAGSAAGTVKGASITDVIVYANTQAVEENFMPTEVWCHPRTVSKMKTTKNTDGDYVVAPFLTPDGKSIDDLLIVTNPGISEDVLYVLDPMLIDNFVAEEIRFEMGYNGTDFKENKKSLRAEGKSKAVVQGNNKKGIIYVADVDTAAAELELVIQ